jgi:hypothetical protein
MFVRIHKIFPSTTFDNYCMVTGYRLKVTSLITPASPLNKGGRRIRKTP